jgi:Zn-dependent peptidase ImmA (M78 family)
VAEDPCCYPAGMDSNRTSEQAIGERVLVSGTSFGNWEMQAGDPTVFACRVAFLPNPDGPGDRATAEERESWGSFSIWVHGENVCAHIEQGEMVEASHWYLLPFVEWLTDNWDPLLHEERLPLANAGLSAAESLSRTRMPSLSLRAVDDMGWLDTWSAWWGRHCVRSAADGGLFPDLYLRRYRDKVELSTGAEPVAGVPDDFVFVTPNRMYQVDPARAADVLFTVLSRAVLELRRRLPRSPRIERLADKVTSLQAPERETARMAWLGGYGTEPERYAQVADEVNAVLGTVDPEVREQITGTRRSIPLLVAGSAYARLLYGAISPTTGLADVATLTRAIVANYVPDASSWLTRLDLPLDPGEVAQLTPGEQGSRLGEEACKALGADVGGWVDIQAVMERLGIDVSGIDLSDDAIRGVSVFGPTQRPHVFANQNSRWGQRPEVQRFTCAHELCHLILDREHGDELAIATGPWAPLGIEQRANAFAAAFLMPTWLLRDALAAAAAPADDPETVRSISAQLRVSASSLIDRLCNLDEITFDDRIRLRAVWLPHQG